MAAYFPFYFYKAFDLKQLRFHAIYGVFLFLLCPFLAFFVVSYSLDEDLIFTVRYGAIIPFFYSFILLRAILIAIRHAENKSNTEQILVYCAVVPWSFMSLIAYLEFNQAWETLFANIGFLIVTGIFICKSVRLARRDHKQLAKLSIDRTNPGAFIANCLHYGLTKMEILVVRMLYKGQSNREVADEMCISEETVKKHIQNTFRKTGAKNRMTMIHILQGSRT
jgi:DNA-binding CsgD family transcriptional regulator